MEPAEPPPSGARRDLAGGGAFAPPSSVRVPSTRLDRTEVVAQPAPVGETGAQEAPARAGRTRARVDCPVCGVHYAPNLTGWACPVCDTAAPGAENRRARLVDDGDNRLLAIVFVATVANVLLLAVLTIFVVKL